MFYISICAENVTTLIERNNHLRENKKILLFLELINPAIYGFTFLALFNFICEIDKIRMRIINIDTPINIKLL